MNSNETLKVLKYSNKAKEPSELNKVEPVKIPKKKKCIIIGGIILGTVIVFVGVFFLIAHYKYNLFGSEIYQVANVKREIYSAEYFTESKKIKTKMAYTSGELEEIENSIETDFVVMISNKEDLLNTANLVILKSKTQIKDKEAPLNSFDIFDEKTVKEFEENPDGSKYPMAEFHFYDNGTIKDIYLPKEMSKDEAQNMIDLINNVIPKLSRNKTEDNNKGIIISMKNLSKKKSFKEYENPKEFTDKYSNCTFKGSKLTKDIEREIENEQINKIRANTNLFLETQEEPENKNYMDFGIKNFYYNSSSKIILTEIKKDKKEDINLVKRLCSKLTLIESEALIQAIIDREIEEKNNLNQNESKSDTPISENKIRTRNLIGESLWEGSFSYNREIIKSNILGQDIVINYYVELKNGKIKNYLVARYGKSNITFGNQLGLNKNKKKGSDKMNDIPLAQIPLGWFFVQLNLKLGSTCNYGVDIISDKFKVDLSGSLFIKAAIELGIANVASIEGGIRGNFISMTYSTLFKRNLDKSFSKDIISLKATAGTVNAYAIAKIWIWTVFSAEYEIFKGYQIPEITY